VAPRPAATSARPDRCGIGSRIGAGTCPARRVRVRHALLVVEVADTSLAHDRERKKKVCARSAIPRYWIVNLVDEVVEAYQKPALETHQNAALLRRGEAVTATIRVDDLLP
jgi:Uma2 family endonuclease